jgi:hypothetical protein
LFSNFGLYYNNPSLTHMFEYWHKKLVWVAYNFGAEIDITERKNTKLYFQYLSI